MDLSIALAQTNPSTGALDENAASILEFTQRAAGLGADVVLFPELALSGYGGGDLFLRQDLLEAAERTVAELAGRIEGITALVGYPEPAPAASRASRVPGETPPPIAYNTIALIEGGRVAGRYRKQVLTRAAGTDQPGRFLPGSAAGNLEIGQAPMELAVGLEALSPGFGRANSPLLLADGTPYRIGGPAELDRQLGAVARDRDGWLARAGFGGGQDELVFAGASTLYAPDGSVSARAALFEEDLVTAPFAAPSPLPDDTAQLYSALVAGTRDYAAKNGFTRIGLGLSGGVDSALAAVLAVDAIGATNVHPVTMPSRFTSSGTRDDAGELARRLGCELLELPIAGPLSSFEDLLGDDAEGVAHENLQARIRGVLLMTLANRRGWLVLNPSNRSEVAAGYSTLYGDMVGGLAPMQSVPKTTVYELCRYRNQLDGVVPESILERAPSAELRDDQKDEDSLPPYEVLDRILELMIGRGLGPDEIVAGGEDAEVTARIARLLSGTEFKRRQAAPGLRLTGTDLGLDLRLPLSDRFTGR